MRKFITLLGASLTALGIALVTLGCGEKTDSETENAKSDQASETDRVAKSDRARKTDHARALEGKMLGYWAPNLKAMSAQATQEAAADPRLQSALPMILAAMKTMAVEVRRGEVTIHTMGHAESSTYKILKTDKAARMITMEVTDREGVDEGTAIIDGNTLILENDGEELILDRISESDFKDRLEAAADQPGLIFPGLESDEAPPIPIPPIPIPPTPTPIPTPAPTTPGAPTG